MPRTDNDQTWVRNADGTMHLVSEIPNIIGDDQIALEQAPAKILAALSAMDSAIAAGDAGTWTAADVKNATLLNLKVTRALLRRILRQ